MKRLSKPTSYGCYIDCEIMTTTSIDGETRIVGELAEHLHDLENRVKFTPGDNAYFLNSHNKIDSCTIEEIHYTKKGNYCTVSYQNKSSVPIIVDMELYKLFTYDEIYTTTKSTKEVNHD